jgi:serine/threonine protein kinase
MASPATQETLRTVGRYEILEKIARGSMGAVYQAFDPTTRQHVAVKVAAPEMARDPVLLKRFEQEFRVASTLCHPSLVRALDFGQDGPNLYLVMELVEGEDLWERLRRVGRLPEAEAVAIIVQVADGVNLAHKHGIIHRDIKPDNILLTAGGQAKLTDLGLIKDLESDQNLTCANKGLGTPNFIAPEQFTDAKHAGVRCDIYGLAATLYMALTGEMPFQGRGMASILKKKLQNDLIPPRQLVPALSERVDWVVRRSLQADPSRRHPSCPEFVAALREDAPQSSVKSTGKHASHVRLRGQERRAWVRYQCSLETSCNLHTSVHRDQIELQDRWQATLQNLSVGGVGLILTRRFERGTMLTLELQGKEEAPRYLEMKVARNERLGKGRWLLGCVFLEPLSKDELRKLL